MGLESARVKVTCTDLARRLEDCLAELFLGELHVEVEVLRELCAELVISHMYRLHVALPGVVAGSTGVLPPQQATIIVTVLLRGLGGSLGLYD